MNTTELKTLVEESFKEYKTYINKLNEHTEENQKMFSDKKEEDLSSKDLDSYVEISLMRESANSYAQDLLKKTEVYLYFGELNDLDEEIQSTFRTLKNNRPEQHYALVNGNIKPVNTENIKKIKKYLKNNDSFTKEVEKMVNQLNS